jgi:hypothetical protein
VVATARAVESLDGVAAATKLALDVTDPTAVQAALDATLQREVAQTSIVRGVAEQHRRPNGGEHLPVDLAAVQVARRGHPHQHGLHRRPDRHPTIVSSLNTFRRDTPSINTQVTALQRGYLRRSESLEVRRNTLPQLAQVTAGHVLSIVPLLTQD